ncbi:SusC/RagA family TonB-linked outer membrane protein [Porphyromonas pogonae]|uniref:SusC/RagA family TonB-linked outer membrane protein n=1 Tax=Porphyromonas pogonae TaxID=867595 RepID=UPI002E78B101|nr:SusC/RagA family TonB-linked outer membrane protein [Porphyromonas pogonae]
MKKFTLFFATLIASIGIALAQQKVVSGIVISSEDGQPIIGASVRLKSDPKIGGSTDVDGKFKFQAPTSAKTLVISFVGMKTTEVPITPNMRVVLASDAQQLNEVVVTGMGIKREQKSLGYSTQNIKSDELKAVRTTDVNNALAGKIAGARFMGGSAASFNSGTIVLRGSSTLDVNGSEPIYVVDGVITNKNMINMDDVANINVLKGPAATSVYGSEGGNGAIIITTKGVSGEDQNEISFSHTLTVDLPKLYYKGQGEYGGGSSQDFFIYKWKEGQDPKLKGLNGGRYITYADDISWGPKFDGKPYIPYYAWDPTDSGYATTAPWQYAGDKNLYELFRNGLTNTTNVAFGRAGKNHMTRISFSNVQKKGVLFNSDAFRRYLTFKTHFTPLDNLTIDLDYKYTYRQNHNGAVEGYRTSDGLSVLMEYQQWFQNQVDLKRLKTDYMRPDGTYRTWNINGPNDLKEAFHGNPFATMDNTNKTENYTWSVFTGSAKYDITKHIDVAYSIMGNLRNYFGETKYGFNLQGLTPFYGHYQNRTVDIRNQGRLGYRNDDLFDRKLSILANLFIESRSNVYDNVEGKTVGGLVIKDLYNLSNSQDKPEALNERIKSQQQSIFATASFGWDNTYYVDFNIRNDWNSTLPDHKNSFLYGGGSASIILSNLFESDVLNFWKIRGSAAQVGSTIAPYNVYQTYSTDKFGTLTYEVNNRELTNPEIKPTISTSYEVGTEFKLFNRRFWGDINLYDRRSKNQIIPLNITPFSGYSYRYINAGEIRNYGIEVSLGVTPVKTKDWRWDVNFNWAINRNKLEELADDVQQRRVRYFGFNKKIYQYNEVGEALGVIRGNDWKKDPNGNMILRKTKYGLEPIVGNDESLYYGSSQPKYTGGLSTGITWKDLSLRASLDFSVGGKMASVTNMWGEGAGLLKTTVGQNNRGGEIRGDWTKDGGVPISGVQEVKDAAGKITYVPVEGYVDAYRYFSELKPNVWKNYLYNATYMKLRELAISYQLPKRLLSKTPIKAASLSLVASNPWLIYSSIPNVDTSETVASAAAGNSFIEGGQTVSTKSIGFTVSLNF